MFVEYKYEGEDAPELVLEEELQRGIIKGEEFPDPTPGKVVEYSEIRVEPTFREGGWNAYKSKTQRFMGRTPEKTEKIKLQAEVRAETITKEQIRERMEEKRVSLLTALLERYPPVGE